MIKGIVLLIVLTVCGFGGIRAQTCSGLGQNPGSAFPVCASKEFVQHEVPLCGGKLIPGPCDDDEVSDLNPFWYKFTCFKGGTLGFEIVPADLSDDYDWQLFDITGHAPEDVYTNKDLFVACNWSGLTGKTGASDAGTTLVSCGGEEQPIYSAMPTLVEGHEYLLLISHFTISQSGYTLSFNGGTADITDTRVPAIETATGSCEGTEIAVKVNKPVKCNSISPDGSDFIISSGAANIVSASSGACESGFNTDLVLLRLDRVIASGTYSVSIRTGSDGNTLLDNCDSEIGELSTNFTVPQNVSAAFTFQQSEGCTRDTVRFIHDGANSVNSWNWTFDEHTAHVQQPMMVFETSGTKNVQLIVSNGYCNDTASTEINVKEKLNASFSGPEILCARDEAVFLDASTGDVNRWQWNFGNGSISNQKDPLPFTYPGNAGERKYRVTLTVSNSSGCSDSSAAEVVVVGNCNIVVPSAFTPNRDGKNDELYPTNAFNTDNLTFRVYNRYGQIIFESKDWRKKWDGTMNGHPQPSGTYVWTLSYVLKATGRNYSFRGTTVLIR